MQKRSDEDWKRLFEEQARSGLSAAAFCRQHTLCAKHFGKRRRQLLGKPAEQAAFVPTRLARMGRMIEIQWGVVRLQIPVDVPADWLAELMHALKG